MELANNPDASISADTWIADLNDQTGINKGLITGYFQWLGNAIRFKFGLSWRWQKPCTAVFAEKIWYTFALNIVAMICTVLIAIPLGIRAARRQYGFADYSSTALAMICISLPTFFLISLFKLVFAVKLQWLDLSGMTDARVVDTLSGFGKFWNTVKHMILPVMTLTIVQIGSLMRYTRTNMLEVLSSDYIRTARAKGVPERRVIYSHAFRNTLIPLITILSTTLVSLFSGSIIVEQLYGFSGIGMASYEAMLVGDVPFTMFYLLFISLLTLVGNLIADILYAVADPRVRLS